MNKNILIPKNIDEYIGEFPEDVQDLSTLSMTTCLSAVEDRRRTWTIKP